MKKKLLSILLLISILTSILPATNVFAGGYVAILYIKWVEYQSDFSKKHIILSDESILLGENPEVIIPDGTKRPSEYSYSVDQLASRGSAKEWIDDNVYLKHLYLAFDETNICLQAGRYKLAPDFLIPEGYEFDDAICNRNDVGVTITQEDVNKYWAMVKQPGGGTMYWIIDVPVKKEGKTSGVFEKIPTPRFYADENSAYIGPDYKAPDFESYEIQYTTKSNSGFKTISKLNYVNYGSAKALQHGKTYYFRARVVREKDGKKYYSKWSEVKKTKVNKIDVYDKLTLWLQPNTRNSENLFLKNRFNGGAGRNWKITYKYSTKKSGPYKTIKGITKSPCVVETLQKKAGMKKGKTYYIKAIAKVPCDDGTYVNVVTGALKYVGR